MTRYLRICVSVYECLRVCVYVWGGGGVVVGIGIGGGTEGGKCIRELARAPGNG